MKGKTRHDFDISFRKATKALYESNISVEEKLAEVEKMTEGYYVETGEFPSDTMLEKLADVLLSDELRNPDSFKVRRTEYPILSTDQMKRSKNGVELNEDEVNYHNNTLLSIYFVYKPTISTLEKTVLQTKERRRMTYFDNSNLIEKKKYKGRGRTEEDAKWSKTIKERDGYCCQNPNCRSRVGIMHAHHIDSYVDNPYLRTSVTNGITLCVSCHTEFHSIFGKGGNNRRQIDEFFIGA